MSDLEDDLPVEQPTDENFYKATKFLEHNTKLFKQDQLLKLYGLYKQATVGSCNIPKPGIFNTQQRAKWFAWDECKDLDQQSAKTRYVQLIDSMEPSWNQSQPNESSTSWVSVSLPKREEDVNPGTGNSLLDYVKEGDVKAVQNAIVGGNVSEQINILDGEGLGILHWAADRGNISILQSVLDIDGIDVNLRDIDGQTALHYASCCGYEDCIRLLLKYNADRNIKDDNGDACIDVAFADTIKELLK